MTNKTFCIQNKFIFYFLQNFITTAYSIFIEAYIAIQNAHDKPHLLEREKNYKEIKY